MNREEFFKFVEQNIKSYLPMEYQDATIQLMTTTKTNLGEVHGINVSQEGENVTPTFYLDRFYEDYIKGGEDIFPVMEAVTDMIVQQRDHSLPEDIVNKTYELNNYNFVRQNLTMKLCDFESNQAYLQEHAYTRKGDFAVTYHIKIDQSNQGMITTPVTTHMLAVWGKTIEEFHQDALQVQVPENRPILMRIEEFLMNNLGLRSEEPVNYLQADELPDMGNNPINLLALTNESKINGAAMIIYPEVLDKIGELLGQDYYVLPSSLHEVIITIAESQDAQELQEMVKEINEAEVDAADVLSDRVQYYDTAAHVLENAFERMERLENPQKGQEKVAEVKMTDYPKKAVPELRLSF